MPRLNDYGRWEVLDSYFGSTNWIELCGEVDPRDPTTYRNYCPSGACERTIERAPDMESHGFRIGQRIRCSSWGRADDMVGVIVQHGGRNNETDPLNPDWAMVRWIEGPLVNDDDTPSSCSYTSMRDDTGTVRTATTTTYAVLEDNVLADWERELLRDIAAAAPIVTPEEPVPTTPIDYSRPVATNLFTRQFTAAVQRVRTVNRTAQFGTALRNMLTWRMEYGYADHRDFLIVCGRTPTGRNARYAAVFCAQCSTETTLYDETDLTYSEVSSPYRLNNIRVVRRSSTWARANLGNHRCPDCSASVLSDTSTNLADGEERGYCSPCGAYGRIDDNDTCVNCNARAAELDALCLSCGETHGEPLPFCDGVLDTITDEMLATARALTRLNNAGQWQTVLWSEAEVLNEGQLELSV